MEIDTISLILLGIALCLLMVSGFLMWRCQALAKTASKTPIYIEPTTGEIAEDAASEIPFLAELYLHRGNKFLVLAIGAFLGAIGCEFRSILLAVLSKLGLGLWQLFTSVGNVIGPLVWPFFFYVFCFMLGLLYVLYDIGLRRIEPDLKVRRKKYCNACKEPLKKYAVKATDFLTDVELAEHRAGTLKCRANQQLCATCSFPLTRETVNLRLFRNLKDRSVQCPQCSRYTFTTIQTSGPLQNDRLGEAGYLIIKRQCHYCGHQGQRQHPVTLSSVETSISDFLSKKRYRDRMLIQEIEQLIQCDETGEGHHIQACKLICKEPGLARIRYLSIEDKKRAIEFIQGCVQKMRDWEADPRNSPYGPD